VIRFRIAEEALHQVLERKLALDEARKSFVAALQEAKLFIP